jgi:SAM-dependent methyltransferase
MRLSGLRRHWNEFGRSDPLWAILTAPDKKGNRWAIDEFLQTGRDEIAALIRYLDARGLTGGRRRAIDFGCGAGRLTHALADHFDQVIGVDIAPSIVDLVYTLLVLQHMHPRYIRQYLTEFVRVLRPGGVLVFQLPAGRLPPAEPRGLKKLLPMPVIESVRALRRLRDFPRMEIHGIPRSEVERLLVDLGAPVVDVVDDRSHVADTPGFRYCAVKLAR